MTNTTLCADCAVAPGQPHVDGCDVARCTACGWQRISCEHEDSPHGWGQVWTGEYPGALECLEYDWWRDDDPVVPGRWPDVNKLDALCRAGLMVWIGYRWILTPAGRATPGVLGPGARS